MISPWLQKKNNLNTNFSHFLSPRWFWPPFFVLICSPLKAYLASVDLTQSEMANLIDYGLIHPSFSLSRSLAIYVSISPCVSQSEGIAEHGVVDIILLRFNDRACVLLCSNHSNQIYVKKVKSKKKKNNSNNKMKKEAEKKRTAFAFTVSGEFFTPNTHGFSPPYE